MGIDKENHMLVVYNEYYMTKPVSYAISSRGQILVEGDMAYDTNFPMYYMFYRIFEQKKISDI